jgi:hypothetical protein
MVRKVQHPTGYTSRGGAWALVAGLAILAVLLGLVGSPPAAANHTDNADPRLHNQNVHYGEVYATQEIGDEDFCVQSRDEERVSTATAREWIRTTLLYDAPYWDGTAGGRIDLWLTPESCDFVPDANAVELRYVVHANPFAEVGGNCLVDNQSCVNPSGAVWDPTFEHSHWMHQNIHLDTDNLLEYDPQRDRIAIYHRLINHESGHVWSLLDPVEFGDCAADSVMHTFENTYGCPFREYPTAADFESVTGVADGTR